MYILARSERLENSKDNRYLVRDTEMEKKYLDAGYQQYERNYTIKEQYREYIVVCPEFRKDAAEASPIVILPDFLIPGRPYPVYVYLFAIRLYSTHPEKGQRWAAAETRKQYGLSTFAHTTLGRAMKAFVRNIEEDAPTTDGGAEGTSIAAAKPSGFPTVRATASIREKAAKFLHRRLAAVHIQRTAAVYNWLVKERFKECGRFLL
jgi:hypothetical protein